MTHVVYWSRQKGHEVARALMQGFDADDMPLEAGTLVPGATHIIGGLQFGALTLLKRIRAAGEPYIFYDRAYFGGGPGTGRYRVVPNAYQHHELRGDGAEGLSNPQPVKARQPFRDWGVKLAPWRESRPSDRILLVPPSPAVALLFGLGDWLYETHAELAHLTRRPVDVSFKGDRRPLAERLRNCHAVVTWTSNVAVDAIVAGVPAFVAQYSAARPVAAGDVEHLTSALLENPPKPDRSTWLRSLSAGQFDLADIAAGRAREVPKSALETTS